MTATGTLKRQRALSCTAEEQDMIRRQARKAGKSHSRYILDLVRADDPERHALVLSEAEQAAVRDGTAEVTAFVRALRRELPGGSGLSLLSAIAVMARAGRETKR